MEFIYLLQDAASAVWHRFPMAVLITGTSILVLLVLITILSRRRSERDEFGERGHGIDRRYEPDLYGGYNRYDDDFVERRGYEREPHRNTSRVEAKQKRFGFFALSLVFLFGIVIGFGTLAASKRYGLAPGLVRIVERVEAAIGPSSGAESAPPQVTEPAPPQAAEAETETPSKVQDRVGTKTDNTIDAKLETFVRGLQAQLPTPIDQTTNLVSVTEDDRIVTLGFSVSQLVPDLDQEKFQASLKGNIEANACRPSGSPGVRELNLEGVEFMFIYTDQVGKTLARVRLPPGFCENVG